MGPGSYESSPEPDWDPIPIPAADTPVPQEQFGSLDACPPLPPDQGHYLAVSITPGYESTILRNLSLHSQNFWFRASITSQNHTPTIVLKA